MIWPNYLSVILPAAFSTIHALHLPTPSNQTVAISSELAYRWGCRFVPLNLPPHHLDCTGACLQLPNSRNQSMFHNAGEDDGYKLPVEKSYATCALRVSLLEDGGQDEECSWADIAFRAEVLNGVCINGRNTGGYMEAGSNHRIKIEFSGVNLRNGTVGEELVDMT